MSTYPAFGSKDSPPLPAGGVGGVRAGRRPRWRGWSRRALLLACLPGVWWNVRAAGVEPRHAVVATYLLHFALFTTWPEDAFAGPDAPWAVGVIGRDPLGNKVEEVFRGEKVAGRRVVVRRYRADETPKDCQMLFLGELDSWRVVELLRAFESRPVLTLSLLPGFCERGGQVGFFLSEGDRVRFEVHRARLKAARLNLHSRLLNLAKIHDDVAAP